MTRLLITLCTYNERENLELLIPEVLQQATGTPAGGSDSADPGAGDDPRHTPPSASREVTVLVIDDGSPDGTGDLVRQMAQRDDRIRLLQRGSKQGLGTATLAGFRYAMEHGFDELLNLDADFSHQPKYIPALLSAMDVCDVAIGSRYVPGGSVGDWSLGRRLMSRGINAAARLLLGLTTRDNSGAYRCYRVSRLAGIDWSRTLATGYAFQEEVLYRCRRIGCRFQEVPIVFDERRFGQTKINLQECVTALLVLMRLGWHNLTRRPVAVPPTP